MPAGAPLDPPIMPPMMPPIMPLDLPPENLDLLECLEGLVCVFECFIY